MFTALVIDAHPIVRSAIKMVLEKNEFVVVSEAGNGVEGVGMVREHRPNLVVMDIDFLGMSGPDVIKKIYDFDRSIKILVLISGHAVHFYNRCKIARASGILSKACSIEEFEEAIYKLMCTRAHEPTRCSFWPEHTDYQEVLLIESLSDREFMTFQLLALGLSNKQIATYLSLSGKTVSTYKTRLLKKLNVFSVVHLSAMAERNHLV